MSTYGLVSLCAVRMTFRLTNSYKKPYKDFFLAGGRRGEAIVEKLEVDNDTSGEII